MKRRAVVAAVMGCVVLAAASCAGPERPTATATATADGKDAASTSASPAPSATATPTVDDAVAAARERMTAAATGRDAPGPEGLLVAAGSTGGALFVWESSDGRFCHGAAMGAGMTSVACFTRPHTPPVGKEPRLVPMVRMMATGWNVVFGAEHETVESVTCDGVPVRVEDVGVMADGRRSVHAVEFPDLTLGTVSVRVRRGSRVVTETLALETFAKKDTARFASCGKPTS
ncbi:hypothetical protein [Streptomyces sp. NE5-10]|uniref:hypothetical protein n=1 Tax=Streptomyces sp. NE5-10 TaxID=2759674 RepID=UPI00190534C7|nr:hypothetical protein [Streptomyces sp. NE5-10]